MPKWMCAGASSNMMSSSKSDSLEELEILMSTLGVDCVRLAGLKFFNCLHGKTRVTSPVSYDSVSNNQCHMKV
jgi:hypothetical protein